ASIPDRHTEKSFPRRTAGPRRYELDTGSFGRRITQGTLTAEECADAENDGQSQKQCIRAWPFAQLSVNLFHRCANDIAQAYKPLVGRQHVACRDMREMISIHRKVRDGMCYQ